MWFVVEEIEKIVREVVASFKIDNINVPSDVIYNSIRRLEDIFSKNDNKGKILVKGGNKNV